jgi:septation ring formation regulator EzrA
MNNINWILVLICIVDGYLIRKKNKRIAELENELWDLKERQLIHQPEEPAEQFFEEIDLDSYKDLADLPNNTIYVSPNDYDKIVKELENLTPPNDKLKDAVKKFKERYEKKDN